MSLKLISITEWGKTVLIEPTAHLKALLFAAFPDTRIWVFVATFPRLISSSAQFSTHFVTVSRGWSAQRRGGANAIVVSDCCRDFSFSMSYNGRSTYKDSTACRWHQFKFKFKSIKTLICLVTTWTLEMRIQKCTCNYSLWLKVPS